MGQVTIYLNNDIEKKMKLAAKANDLSISKWISNIISEKVASEWPMEVVKIAGSWKNDFPSLEEIRSNPAGDAEREAL